MLFAPFLHGWRAHLRERAFARVWLWLSGWAEVKVYRSSMLGFLPSLFLEAYSGVAFDEIEVYFVA